MKDIDDAWWNLPSEFRYWESKEKLQTVKDTELMGWSYVAVRISSALYANKIGKLETDTSSLIKREIEFFLDTYYGKENNKFIYKFVKIPNQTKLFK